MLPRHVLVVEDEVIVRIVIADDLREAGFAVTEARDATEALSLLAAGLVVDAIFSDVNMPGRIDGLGFAIEALANYGPLAVVLTSGRSEFAAAAAKRGMSFIDKPYLAATVVAALHAAIDSTKAQHDGPEPYRNGQALGGGC